MIQIMTVFCALKSLFKLSKPEFIESNIVIALENYIDDCVQVTG
ncbi:hypothetical protein N476_09740 [Pseudoalteromonas luteoviolacea H33]|uniref:Uncharacterized protein n=1 Tax=Pseudoalteromonas luteoviolacea H33 TaxID=1365251 RepID=A0A167FRL8_9GAMM|nr:hypothetical protein N476_09740 [Pseudoalteromonas luteoviolacea H33]KZN73835.1 hypothetical protein N477_22715 [Pseudoalteromonas luteoviolacea H33-S]